MARRRAVFMGAALLGWGAVASSTADEPSLPPPLSWLPDGVHACPVESRAALYRREHFYDYRCLLNGDYRLLHGPQIRFGPDGRRWYAGEYRRAQRSGTWTFWNPDGSVNHQVTYPPEGDGVLTCPEGLLPGTEHRWNVYFCYSPTARKPEGPFIILDYWTGRIEFLGSHHKGRRHGTTVEFDEHGRPVLIQQFHHGEVVWSQDLSWGAAQGEEADRP